MDIKPEDISISEWSSKPRKRGWNLVPLNGVIVFHKPSGIQIAVDSERSQHRNKALAMAKLKKQLSTLIEENNYSLKVKIESVRCPEGKFDLLTSHNGSQWSGGTPLTLQELVKIRDVLNTFITEQVNL